MSITMVVSGIFFVGVSAIMMIIYISGLKIKLGSAQIDVNYWKRTAEINQKYLDENFKDTMERIRNDSN